MEKGDAQVGQKRGFAPAEDESVENSRLLQRCKRIRVLDVQANTLDTTVEAEPDTPSTLLDPTNSLPEIATVSTDASAVADLHLYQQPEPATEADPVLPQPETTNSSVAEGKTMGEEPSLPPIPDLGLHRTPAAPPAFDPSHAKEMIDPPPLSEKSTSSSSSSGSTSVNYTFQLTPEEEAAFASTADIDAKVNKTLEENQRTVDSILRNVYDMSHVFHAAITSAAEYAQKQSSSYPHIQREEHEEKVFQDPPLSPRFSSSSSSASSSSYNVPYVPMPTPFTPPPSHSAVHLHPKAKEPGSEVPLPMKTDEPKEKVPAHVPAAAPGLDGKKVEKSKPAHVWTAEQNRVLKAFQRGENIAIFGPAGTGKSSILEEMVRLARDQSKTFYVTSLFGPSAQKIGGTTLHSYAGIQLGESTPQAYFISLKRYAKNPNSAYNRWLETQILFVDECVLWNVSYFEKLSTLACLIRDNNKPFGGIQLVMMGDHMQTPPIVKPSANPLAPRFLFQSPMWRRTMKTIICLQQVHRQKESAFVALLMRARYAQLTAEDWAILQSRVQPRDVCGSGSGVYRFRNTNHTNSIPRPPPPPPLPPGFVPKNKDGAPAVALPPLPEPTMLFPFKNDAAECNARRLNLLPKPDLIMPRKYLYGYSTENKSDTELGGSGFGFGMGGRGRGRFRGGGGGRRGRGRGQYRPHLISSMTSGVGGSGNPHDSDDDNDETGNRQRRQQHDRELKKAMNMERVVHHRPIDDENTPIEAKRIAKQMADQTPDEAQVHVRLGAQVMLTRNINMKAGLVNGLRGEVVGILIRHVKRGKADSEEDEDTALEEKEKKEATVDDQLEPQYIDGVRVRFVNGQDIYVGRETLKRALWDRERCLPEYLWTEWVEVRAVPLMLAYGATIHKIQGHELMAAHVDLGPNMQAGLAYTAISRVRELRALTLQRLSHNAFRVDPIALAFDRELAERDRDRIAQERKRLVFLGRLAWKATRDTQLVHLVENIGEVAPSLVSMMGDYDVPEACYWPAARLMAHLGIPRIGRPAFPTAFTSTVRSASHPSSYAEPPLSTMAPSSSASSNLDTVD